MAKTAKVKKRQVTVHSRAARRATSPSIDLPKSITKAARPSSPTTPTAKPHVLAAQNAGITKKSKGKQLKRQQRVRQLKSMEKAADALDKLEAKVQKSVGHEKKVRERRKGWEELNGPAGRKKNVFDILDADEVEDQRREREWVSEEEMDGAEESIIEPEVQGEVKEVVVPASMPLPRSTVEDDELL